LLYVCVCVQVAYMWAVVALVMAEHHRGDFFAMQYSKARGHRRGDAPLRERSLSQRATNSQRGTNAPMGDSNKRVTCAGGIGRGGCHLSCAVHDFGVRVGV
jgi:hypothetical protein